MQLVTFSAVCEFEIGDQVLVGNKICKITDIAAIHLLREQKVVFQYQLNDEHWVRLEVAENGEREITL